MANTGNLKVPRAIWTRAHLDELENAFPERTNQSEPGSMSYERGQRSVVQLVRLRVNKEEGHGI